MLFVLLLPCIVLTGHELLKESRILLLNPLILKSALFVTLAVTPNP